MIGPWPHRETRGTSRHWIHLPYLRGRCRERHLAPTPLIHPPYYTGEGAALLLWSWSSKGQRPIPYSCCYHAVLDYEGVRRTILFSGGLSRPPPLVVLNNFDRARSLLVLGHEPMGPIQYPPYEILNHAQPPLGLASERGRDRKRSVITLGDPRVFPGGQSQCLDGA